MAYGFAVSFKNSLAVVGPAQVKYIDRLFAFGSGAQNILLELQRTDGTRARHFDCFYKFSSFYIEDLDRLIVTARNQQLGVELQAFHSSIMPAYYSNTLACLTRLSSQEIWLV